MDWEIGEIRQIKDEWYQCLEDTNDCHCDDCELEGVVDCYKIACRSDERIDNKNVYFKKLEKVGEPYMLEDKKFQKYRVFHTPYIYNKIYYSWQSFADPYYISLEIKQNKEDMEEYKMYDAKEDILEFDKVVDECLFGKQELKLKPFDIQKAKAGKPVCTRDGRSVRILCFDAKRRDEKNIIALVPSKGYPGFEDLIAYPDNGIYYGEHENDGNLMMMPEKKEGWAKVRKDINLYDTKEEADRKMIGNDEYVTAKVEWEE
jgi:hypothetical protein